MTLEEKIRGCIERHPDWDTKRISNSTGGSKADVEAVRRGESIAPRSESPFAPPVPGPAAISLARVKERFDIAAAITRALSTVKRGTLLPEEELCRMTAGRDRNRFRRAVDNHPDLARAHRVKLRLDDATDGKYYWGHSEDIQEALRLRDM